MKGKVKDIVFAAAIVVLAASNAYMLVSQSRKNERYENAIGFFKLATRCLNIGSPLRLGIIDYYSKLDTANVYDINGKFPDDYFEDYNEGKVGLSSRDLAPWPNTR